MSHPLLIAPSSPLLLPFAFHLLLTLATIRSRILIKVDRTTVCCIGTVILVGTIGLTHSIYTMCLPLCSRSICCLLILCPLLMLEFHNYESSVQIIHPDGEYFSFSGKKDIKKTGYLLKAYCMGDESTGS